MFRFACIVFGWLWAAFPGQAAPNSAAHWREGTLKLIEMPAEPGKFAAMLRLDLAPGFKTYWINPGDSGLGPTFNFAHSQGVQALRVDLPFPARFEDGAGGTLIGYREQTAFMITGQRINAQAEGTNPASPPIVLQMHIAFAICQQICLPLEARLTLQEGATRATPDDRHLYAKMRAQLPQDDTRPEDPAPDRSAPTYRNPPSGIEPQSPRPAWSVIRLPGAGKPRWQIDLPWPEPQGTSVAFSAFPMEPEFRVEPIGETPTTRQLMLEAMSATPPMQVTLVYGTATNPRRRVVRVP